MFNYQPGIPKEFHEEAFGHHSAYLSPVISEETNIGSVKNSFQFQYVPEEQFARIVRDVRRNRKKKQEEKEWLKFLASKNKTCQCDTCPEGLKYLREKNIVVSQVSEQQHKHNYSQKKHEQQLSPVSISQEKCNNPVDEIPKSGKKRERQICLEPSASLRREMQNESSKTLFSQSQIDNCIHVGLPKHQVEELVHNAGLREEFPQPYTSQCCVFSNMHCRFHAELVERNENSREDIYKHKTCSAEENVNVLPFKSVAPKFNHCEIREDELNCLKENGDILHIKSAPEMNHCETPCSNCPVEENIAILPIEPEIPMLNHCWIQKDEAYDEICPREENVKKFPVKPTTFKLNYCGDGSHCHSRHTKESGFQRSGEHYSDCQIEETVNNSPSEPAVSKLNEAKIQKDGEGLICPNDILPVETLVPKLNLCGLQRDGAHSLRIRTMRKKIDAAFDNLLQQLQNVPEPDGSQDLMRRRKRAAEFSARFARNYLYHLRHQVCEIKKQIKESSSTCRGQHTLHQALCHKLVLGHQTALQGLQAYIRHIPSSVKGSASSKIKELFQSLTELSVLCNELRVLSPESSSEYGTDTIEKKSRKVFELINDEALKKDIDNDTIASQETAVNVMTTTGQREWASSLREPEKNSSSARGPSVKPTFWKDKATKLARATYGSPYKKRHFISCRTHKRIGTSKTDKKKLPARSQVEMQPAQETMEDLCPVFPNPLSPPPPKNHSKLKLMEERKIGDDIKTAIEFIPCEHNFQAEQSPSLKSGSALKMPYESATGLSHRSLPNKLVDFCEGEICGMLGPNAKAREDKSEETETQERLKQLDGQPSSPAVLKAVIQQIQTIASNTLQQIKTDCSSHTMHAKEMSKLLVTGSKNAQLICLPLSAEIEEDGQNCKETEHKKCSKESNKNDEDLKHRSTNLREENCYNNKSELNVQDSYASPDSSKSSEKILESIQKNSTDVHAKEFLPTALTLSKKVIRSAMNCRQDFQNYMKANPMYKDTAQPWITVERLSERMIDELLQEMASETKLDILINGMYNMELQGKGNVTSFNK